jgi:UDP-4-amino-4-deoxy-L-arabinose formyltransferase/UDP-glucuronic acid dehydrogenase (UDP-4-keto-hexauronic acid decarboxylating)
MKTVVFAYHDMGITGLEALQRAGLEIAAIFSHEDDPGENCWFGSVPDWAVRHNIPLFCPENVNTDEWFRKIASLKPDVIFSFYYRHLLSKEVLAIPSAGALNLHGSLLPHYRGRCPVNWVLVNGETETGVTLHRMVEKADAGDIVAQKVVPIDLVDTARTLYNKLCTQAASLLDEILPMIKDGTAPRIRQDLNSGSYFGRRTPEDGRIDWHWSALRIYNLIRAVTEPYPGAFTITAEGERMTIWWALPEAGALHSRPAGQVQLGNDTVFVYAGEGRLKLSKIEINSSYRNDGEIYNYFRDREGEILS